MQRRCGAAREGQRRRAPDHGGSGRRSRGGMQRRPRSGGAVHGPYKGRFKGACQIGEGGPSGVQGRARSVGNFSGPTVHWLEESDDARGNRTALLPDQRPLRGLPGATSRPRRLTGLTESDVHPDFRGARLTNPDVRPDSGEPAGGGAAAANGPAVRRRVAPAAGRRMRPSRALSGGRLGVRRRPSGAVRGVGRHGPSRGRRRAFELGDVDAETARHAFAVGGVGLQEVADLA